MNNTPQTDDRLSSNGLARLTLLLAAALSSASLSAADIPKADNADALNVTTSWSGGVVPGGGDVALWDGTVTGALTNLLAANTTWQGIRLTNPGGAAQIDATSTNANAGAGLTLGAAGIDLSGALQDLTINAPVTIGPNAVQQWQVASGRTLTLAARPTKPGVAQANSGVLGLGTTGTIRLGTNAVSILQDPSANPYALYGAVDWAATDASGIVIPAAYQVATNSFTGAVNWDITSSVSPVNNTADALSLRFNSPSECTVMVLRTRTLTARGILVTSNAGPSAVTRQATVANQNAYVRSTSANSSGLTFNIIQQSTNDFTLSASLSTGSSSSPTRLVKSGRGRLILAATNGIESATRLSNEGLNGPNAGIVIHEGTVTVNLTNVNIGSNAPIVIHAGKLELPSGANQKCASLTVNDMGTNSVRITSPGGSLFIASNLVLNAGAPHLEFSYDTGIAPSATVAPLSVSNLTLNGAAVVDVLCSSLVVGTTNPLVKYESLSGTGSFGVGFLPPRIVAHIETNLVNKTIDLVVDAVNQPIRWAKGSDDWDLNNETNWVDTFLAPTTYTQSGVFGDSVLFEDAQSGGSPITVTLNAVLTPAAVTVNAAKNYTLSGSGGVGGAGNLTKAGAGTLTLATANTFAGGITLNGGTTVFSTLNNLGSGPVTFGGGTLQYSGNTDDLSLRTVTLAAGGGGINVGAVDVTFTKPIGNNGAGGLTKLGSGTLKLSGTNLYSGTTTISAGTLWLSPDGSSVRIPNSPAIVIAGGATLDVATQGGLTLSSSAGQTLRGTGSVNGDLTAPAGTTVSPAETNVVGTLTLTNSLTVDGGTLVFDVNNSTRDLLNVGGTLTLNSGTIKVIASGLNNGSYKLIGYSGGLGGALGNMTLDYSQAGKAVSLADSGTEISLVVESAASDNLVWAGVGGTWDAFGSLHWLKGATPWAFTNGSTVTFDSTGSAITDVFVTGEQKPSAITVNNGAGVNYTFWDGGSGKISGATGLTKSGAGTLTVLTPNNNSGPTVINAGIVQVGNNSSSGDLGTGNVTNNGALVFQQTDNRSVPGVISGSGSLAQQGTAVLTLGADNTYTGPTTIASGGTLSVGAGSAAGSLPATSVITNDGTLVLNSTAHWNLAAPVRGAGALVKSNSNTVTLSGANTYSNGTVVAGGTLKPASAAAWPGGTLTVSSGTFDVNGLDLKVDALAGAAGSQRVVNNSGTATNVFTLGNSDATGAYSGTIADNDGTGGKVRVVKIGAGTQTLGGVNTYSGGSVVSNGVLRVAADSLGSGAVTLQGGTLDLTGNGAIFNTAIDASGGGTLGCQLGGAANLSVAGPITGSTNLTLLLDNVEVLTVNGSLAGFSGTLDFTNSVGRLRLASGNGSASAVFDLGSDSARLWSLGGTSPVGALKGTAGTALEAYSVNCTFSIGALGVDTTFEGSIRNSLSVAPFGKPNLTKVGAGTLTLTGDNSLSTGDYTVENGVLAFSGLANLGTTTNITVRAGAVLDIAAMDNPMLATTGVLRLGVDQVLTGGGTVRGALDMTDGGTLQPGDGLGNLTLTNTAILGGAVVMQLNRTNTPATNDMLTALTVTAGGALTVTNLGPDLHTGDTFKLFSVPVIGTFAAVELPATFVQDGVTNNYVWTNKLAVDGTIEVLAGFVPPPLVNTNATNITAVFAPGTVALSWPESHIGWRLEVQTNTLAVGLSNNWVNLGYTNTNSVTLTVDPVNPTVFFRLTYP